MLEHRSLLVRGSGRDEDRAVLEGDLVAGPGKDLDIAALDERQHLGLQHGDGTVDLAAHHRGDDVGIRLQLGEMDRCEIDAVFRGRRAQNVMARRAELRQPDRAAL